MAPKQTGPSKSPFQCFRQVALDRPTRTPACASPSLVAHSGLPFLRPNGFRKDQKGLVTLGTWGAVILCMCVCRVCVNVYV